MREVNGYLVGKVKKFPYKTNDEWLDWLTEDHDCHKEDGCDACEQIQKLKDKYPVLVSNCCGADVELVGEQYFCLDPECGEACEEEVVDENN